MAGTSVQRREDKAFAARGKRGGVVVAVVVVCAVCACMWLGVHNPVAASVADDAPAALLTKATIVDCTASSEEDSTIDTADALLEGLSFVAGNPFFLDVRETLTSPYSFPLPTDSWVEKCEWSYDEDGRVKTATMYKSTNPLSSITLSYDAHSSISKVVGWVTADDGDGRGNVRHDFEVSVVNEALSTGVYGANKFTVVHEGTSSNDTVLFEYDKDKNLTSVSSTGYHTWDISVEYITAFKVPKTLKLSQDGEDAGSYLVPTYDADNKLVSLKTGTWSADGTVMNGDEYEIQYSGGKYSRVRYYQDDVEVKYYEFAYDEDGNLTSMRAYKKGGALLYTIAYEYETE